MKLSKRLKRDGVYLFAVSFLRLLNWLPRRAGLFLGSVLGLTAWKLIPKDQYKTVRHLTLAFGDAVPHARKTTVCRDWYINTGRNLVDIARFREHFDSEIRNKVQVEGLVHFDAAYKRGKGVLGVTGHIGNFELLAAWIASSGYRTAVIGRRMYDERLDRLLIENRRSVGLVNIPTTDSPRTVLRWLSDGNALGVLIDNDSSRVRGVHIPVFGRPANTPISPAVIGIRAGAAFVPMVCLRTLSDGYRIIMYPEVRPPEDIDVHCAARQVLPECHRVLEAVIREHPDQWIWFHNRWHTPPPENYRLWGN